MGFEKFLFYVFGAITLWAAGMVITRRNPVHAVLYLVLTFVASAALWLLVEAEFLGIVLVLVYVGAVMVLFLFVVMMLDIDIATLRAGFVRFLPVATLIALVMAVELFLIVGPDTFGLAAYPQPAPAGPEARNAWDLGYLLYSIYVYPVEVAAVILLVAIVAAIRLTLRHRPDTKYLDPARQVSVKKGPHRIRLVKMTAVSAAVLSSSTAGDMRPEDDSE